jgi:hypothetical protein
MTKPSRDPSIHHEPHLQGQTFSADESEAKAAEAVRRAADKEHIDEQVSHSVWDEPALSTALNAHEPKDALTYANWLWQRRQETSIGKSWLVTIAVVLAAGPWSIVGTFITGFGNGAVSIIAITLVGPLTEEVMKTAAALWVVEKRPFLFTSRLQIMFCVMAAGLCFAVIENLLYLNVYISDPSREIVIWRWTVCVALHVGCTTISGIGLARIWKTTTNDLTPPQLSLGAPFLIAAVIIHSSYNIFAVILQNVLFSF